MSIQWCRGGEGQAPLVSVWVAHTGHSTCRGELGTGTRRALLALPATPLPSLRPLWTFKGHTQIMRMFLFTATLAPCPNYLLASFIARGALGRMGIWPPRGHAGRSPGAAPSPGSSLRALQDQSARIQG